MKVGMAWIASALLVFASSGCALFDRGADDAGADEDVNPERSIAQDFLHALAQLEDYSPERAVVHFVDETLEVDPLVSELEALMRAEGYAVRVVPNANTPGVVVHEVRVDGASGASVHTLSLGEVQMRRSYARTPTGDWRPAGSLFVRGVDASGIRMGEPRRRRSGATEPSPVPASSASQARRARSGTDSFGSGGTPLAFDRLSGKPVYSGLIANSSAVARPRNMMDLGDSNYAGLLDDYGNVEELILMFPNDSLRLGDDNKAQIRKTLERFDPGRDVYSIVGCSLGPTRLENGNQALALGRANRVKEELLFAGVPHERILDEGCWAGESATRFPSRGVVLTLKRQTG